MGPSRWWPWGRVPRSRGWGCLSEEGQIMNRSPTPSWGLLGSAKRWAKMWKLGIDKVHRDVGNSACGPALRKGERKVLSGWAQAMWQSHTAAKALSSSISLLKTPQPGLLTTLSRAPLLKEGWKVMLWAWAPGSPWIMPLGGEETISRQLEAEVGCGFSEGRLMSPDLMACPALTKEVAQTQDCCECEKGG